jgi:hypothetical protein
LVKIEKGEINPNLLPTVDTTGSIGFDSSLEMVSKIDLAGFKFPLTVAGTLGSPIPDIPAFAIELVSGAGQGILNTALLPIEVLEGLGEGILELTDSKEELQMSKSAPRILSVTRQESALLPASDLEIPK